jgi:hypothetical protein
MADDEDQPLEQPAEENPFAQFVETPTPADENPFARFAAPSNDENPFARFVEKPQPEAEGTFGTIARKVAHNVLPTIAAIGTGVVTAPASPWVAIPASIGAFWGTHELQERGLNALGYGDEQQRAANARANPKADIAGDVVSAAIPFGVGPKLALTRRALGAGIGVGLEGAGQYQRGEFDPTRLAVAAGTGALFNEPRAGTAAFERAVQTQAARLTRAVPHGTAGAEAAAGTAEAKPPPTDAGGAQQPVANENYAKAAPRAEDAGGVNVGDVDPTIRAAMEATRPEPAAPDPAAPARTMAAEQHPGDVLRGPEPGAAAPEPAPMTPAAAAPGQKASLKFADPEKEALYREYRRGKTIYDPVVAKEFEDRLKVELGGPTPQAQAGQAGAPRGPAPMAEPPVGAAPPKFSVAKDAETGRHVLFRDDEAIGEFANRGEAIKARNLALIKDTAARRQQAAPEPARAPPLPDAAVPPEATGQTAEPEGTPRPLGAAPSAGAPPSSTPPNPPGPPGKLREFATAIRTSIDNLLDVGRDLQMKVSPMATGTKESMAVLKDTANQLRGINHDWSVADQKLERGFTPEQRKRMWDANDEESVLRQEGKTNEHMGLATLTPEERAGIQEPQDRARAAWKAASDVGLVEGEGLPVYTPRMFAKVAQTGEGPRTLDRMGSNITTTTPQLRQRKYLTAEETEAAAKKKLGDDAAIVRDIRTLPLATAKLEKAVAGRQLINKIEEIGKRTGQKTVSVGAKPTDPEHTWFTMDHPAFYKWRPKLEEADTAAYRAAVESTGGVKVPPAKIPLMDRNGEMVWEKVPVWVRGDFEGPLRSIMTKPAGATYSALMSLKGKTMGLVMNSPLIHNAVEWGRALPAMPGKVATFKIYFEGNRAKNDPAIMREAIDNGLVPIGKRFFNQDISSIAEEPNLTPGRSWTAKVLGALPGLFDAKAGDAVKRSIDRAGDFWHNTLLWDRVGDLQMGLYTNLRDDLVAKGTDAQSAARVAAHWANRYAGALPQEAMSDAARKFANLALFSRSFTLGNLGVMKDMLNGLPRDVRAQISRDVGNLNPETEGYIKSMARRKAISIVMLDMGLMYAGNSLLQSGLNVMRGDRTLDDEARGYADRLHGAMQNMRENPMSLVQPLKFLERLSSTSENEPGKQDRILVGHAKDGTAIYARNPVGKIGEEFAGWASGPLDMLKRKLGTVARPAWQILSNDKGFGRKVYDPNADTPAGYLKNMGLIVEHLFAAQTPEGQIRAAADLARGQGDPNVAAAQAIGPIAGVTFSRGAPGGPAQGELYKAREEHQFQVNAALPDIRRMIQNGDEQGARQRMSELGVPPGLQNFYVRTTNNPQLRLSPRAVQDFNRYAPLESRGRFQRDLEQQQQRQQQPEG